MLGILDWNLQVSLRPGNVHTGPFLEALQSWFGGGGPDTSILAWGYRCNFLLSYLPACHKAGATQSVMFLVTDSIPTAMAEGDRLG